LALGLNKPLWDGLSADDRNAISTACAAEFTLSLAEFNVNNAKSLELLRQDKSIEIRKFDDSLLQALGKAGGEVLADAARKDALTQRVYDSYIAFWNQANRWADLSERGFFNARSLKYPYGDRS
jgi:TRAP-type mannitol/chloroaromatic compound transport system substrate-binding protein